MGAQCPGSGALGGRGDQVVDRVQPHRCPHRGTLQVDEHEITRCRGRNAHPLELVTVERLHHQEIQRYRPLPPRLGHGPVRVTVAADHVQVRAGDLAAQLTGVRQQVHVAAAQPERLAAAQPGPRHQQHDQPVPRRAAPAQQRDDIGVGGPVHRTFRLVQPVPGPVPSVTACTIIPRTAVRTALTRRADLAGTAPGPASTTAPGSASMPDAAGPACASHVMNSPSCSAPPCQSFPVRAPHRRNSAIAPAYALVVDSAPSRPNRRCRKNASANGTTDSSSSSTVQYPAPDGNLTMNARTRDPPILVTDCEQLPATSTAPTEDGSKTTLRVAFPHIMHQVKRPLEKPPNGESTPSTHSPGSSPTDP